MQQLSATSVFPKCYTSEDNLWSLKGMTLKVSLHFLISLWDWKASSGTHAQLSPAPVQNFILIAFHQLNLLLPVSLIRMLWSLCHPASWYTQGSRVVLMETALWNLILPPWLCCLLCRHPCPFWKEKNVFVHTHTHTSKVCMKDYEPKKKCMKPPISWHTQLPS